MMQLTHPAKPLWPLSLLLFFTQPLCATLTHPSASHYIWTSSQGVLFETFFYVGNRSDMITMSDLKIFTADSESTRCKQHIKQIEPYYLCYENAVDFKGQTILKLYKDSLDCRTVQMASAHMFRTGSAKTCSSFGLPREIGRIIYTYLPIRLLRFIPLPYKKLHCLKFKDLQIFEKKSIDEHMRYTLMTEAHDDADEIQKLIDETGLKVVE